MNVFKLIATFQRCVNYPKDAEGVSALVEGLARAARETDIQIEEIVSRCAELSQYCPTDADLLKVAEEIRADRIKAREDEVERHRVENWEKESGPPKPFEWNESVDWNRAKEVEVRRDRMYLDIKLHLHLSAGEWPSTAAMIEAAEQLGYYDYAYCWRRSGPEASLWSGNIPEAVLAKCKGPGVVRGYGSVQS